MLDVEQRKYLIERIKQVANEAKSTIEAKRKFKPSTPQLKVTQILEILEKNDKSRYKVAGPAPYCYPANTFLVEFVQPEELSPTVDYSELLHKLTIEKNKILDEIMLGGAGDAATILKNFMEFITVEKGNFNVN